MFLIAGAVGVFNGVPEPVLMGGMSRIVAENEQGKHSNCPANHVTFPRKHLRHEGCICTFPSVREV